MFTKQYVNVNGVGNIKVRADITEVNGRQGTLKSLSQKSQETLHRGYQDKGKIKYIGTINEVYDEKLEEKVGTKILVD